MPGPTDVATTVGKIAQLHYEGRIKALACVVIDERGELLVYSAHQTGMSFALIGGAHVLAHDLMCLLGHPEAHREEGE